MANYITVDQLRVHVRNEAKSTTRHEYAAQRGFSAQYLCDFLLGRRDPGEKMLDGLGWERVVTYRRKRP
jgi:hypothetical protein